MIVPSSQISTDFMSMYSLCSLKFCLIQAEHYMDGFKVMGLSSAHFLDPLGDKKKRSLTPGNRFVQSRFTRCGSSCIILCLKGIHGRHQWHIAVQCRY